MIGHAEPVTLPPTPDHVDEHDRVRVRFALESDGSGWPPFSSEGLWAGLSVTVREHRPDLSIVDVRLPPGFRDEGLQAALAVRKREPKAPILILSQYVERTYAAELLPQPLTALVRRETALKPR
jgi:CheY-like chemotaxis protein